MQNIEELAKKKLTYQKEQAEKNASQTEDMLEKNSELIKKSIYSKALETFEKNKKDSFIASMEELSTDILEELLEAREEKIKTQTEMLEQLTIKKHLIEKYAYIRNRKNRIKKKSSYTGTGTLISSTIALFANESTMLKTALDVAIGVSTGALVAAVWEYKSQKEFAKENQTMLNEPLTDRELPNESEILEDHLSELIETLGNDISKYELQKISYVNRKTKEIEENISDPNLKKQYITYMLENYNLSDVKQTYFNIERKEEKEQPEKKELKKCLTFQNS